MITGDSLVTGHPIAATTGPQLLPAMFSHTDRATLLATLSTLEDLEADILLPGHGPLHRGSIREAVATARSTS